MNEHVSWYFPSGAFKRPARIFVVKAKSTATMVQCKYAIRRLFGLQYRAVHVNDTHPETVELAEFFFRNKSWYAKNQDTLSTESEEKMFSVTDKRASLIGLLNEYNPSQEEVPAKQQMMAFINQHPECFERSLEIGHITASAWLLNKDGSKALLMHHAKLDKWFQLGGHCDGDCDVLAVAIKEAQEESGIMDIVPVMTDIFDIDIHQIPENSREKAHDHYDVRFLLQVASDEDFVQNSESKELRWIANTPDALPTQERSVVRMFEKWIAKR